MNPIRFLMGRSDIRRPSRAAPLVTALSVAMLCADAAALVIYVGPDGRPGAGGLSPGDAVGDLQQALDTGLARRGKDEPLELRVLPGTYRGQKVRLTSSQAEGGEVAIVRDEGTERPVFDGAGLDAPWLSVDTDGGPIRKLAITGLEVKGYATAITLNGSRDVDARSVTDVVIRNNIFRSIGQTAMTQKAPSTAAVRLVNADRVQIVNNRFVEITNRWSCGLLHAVYLAHGSTDNVIQGNTFQDSCGDAIRFRDGSSGNKVVGNTFIDAWAEAPISDWFCDRSTVKNCTKKTPECPSFANEVADNKVEARKAKAPEPPKAHGDDNSTQCPHPAGRPAAARARFITR